MRSKAWYSRITWEQVQLSEIRGVHPAIRDEIAHFEKIRFLLSQFRHPKRKQALTPEGIAILSIMKPVIVIQGRGGYSCIAGIRTLTAMRAILDPKDLINVAVIPRTRSETIRNFAFTDLVVCTSLHTVYRRAPQILTELIERFQRSGSFQHLMPALKGQRTLAAFMGVKHSTLRSRKHSDSEGV